MRPERLHTEAWLYFSVAPILLCELSVWEVVISDLHWDEQEDKPVKLLKEKPPFYVACATQMI